LVERLKRVGMAGWKKGRIGKNRCKFQRRNSYESLIHETSPPRPMVFHSFFGVYLFLENPLLHVLTTQPLSNSRQSEDGLPAEISTPSATLAFQC
jgi:hypothetical protein